MVSPDVISVQTNKCFHLPPLPPETSYPHFKICLCLELILESTHVEPYSETFENHTSRKKKLIRNEELLYTNVLFLTKITPVTKEPLDRVVGPKGVQYFRVSL